MPHCAVEKWPPLETKSGPRRGEHSKILQSPQEKEMSSKEFLESPTAQKLSGFMAALLARCRLDGAEDAKRVC